MENQKIAEHPKHTTSKQSLPLTAFVPVCRRSLLLLDSVLAPPRTPAVAVVVGAVAVEIG